MPSSTQQAAARLNTDPDILAEAFGGATLSADDDSTNAGGGAADVFSEEGATTPVLVAPFKVVSGSHRATAASAALLEQAGGLEALRRMTAAFYVKMFKDPHLVRGVQVNELADEPTPRNGVQSLSEDHLNTAYSHVRFEFCLDTPPRHTHLHKHTIDKVKRKTLQVHYFDAVCTPAPPYAWDTFIRSHDDPHGERFATWVAEKLGRGGEARVLINRSTY
jgi:hypothetical protein